MTPHTGYIIAAYGFTAIVLAGLVIWSIAQYRGSARALAELEAKLGRKN